MAVATLAVPLIAAEKHHTWQTGQVLEASVEQKTLAFGPLLRQRTAIVDREVYSIQAPDEDYLVTRPITRGRGALTAGMSVQFAIEAKTMFVLISGKEYRFDVLRVSTASQKVNSPQSNAPTADINAVSVSSMEPLDNDAIVKMILAGLKEDTLIRVVELHPAKYVLTLDAVLGLKAAGVSQSVIDAMSRRMSDKR